MWSLAVSVISEKICYAGRNIFSLFTKYFGIREDKQSSREANERRVRFDLSESSAEICWAKWKLKMLFYSSMAAVVLALILLVNAFFIVS